MRVLLVEDEERLASTIARGLRRVGMAVDVALDGKAALLKAATNSYDVIVLDRNLPLIHGDEVCRKLTERHCMARILMLTAAGSIEDRVAGLDLGADDYLPKPFEPRELAARLQRLLRRARASSPPAALRFDGLEIDLERRQVTRLGTPVELTGTEFELLVLLAQEPQKVFSRDQILNRLRGQDADLYTRAVDLLVSRLRKKLEPLDCIKTLRNAGYAFAGARL